ncbi:hypothetical protein MAR_012941 [Mya arenaria]|uniref:Uncharacterized protein n=1 Tax=Mya arenaria TaxID=6604 RepID=A0ABY7G1R2_MYAAR|nr:hypothetical protein MAR_012941 [Mya arenaria]
MRSAIYRILKDTDMNFHIERETEFTKSNRTFNGHLKCRLESGLSRPTQHKKSLYENAPIILSEAVLFLIAFHVFTRGMEFHSQLRKTAMSSVRIRMASS